MTLTLREKVQTFRTSSAFSAGDPFSFSILLGKDLKLPGKFDPSDYLTRLGADLKDKRVCVVCPGNGGLCVEALKAGAASVTAYEPRTMYQSSLSTVSGLASEVFDKSFSKVQTLKSPGAFDVVIWSEGLDDIKDPRLVIDSVILSIADGGVLYFELAHGTAGVVPDRINSWRPNRDGFLGTLKPYSEVVVETEVDGRNQTRKIYTIRNTRAVAVRSGSDQATVTPLAGTPFDQMDDVEYFRKNLMESLAKMRETEKPTGPKTDTKPVGETDLSEVFGREPEPAPGKPSTPKSRRRTEKDSKS